MGIGSVGPAGIRVAQNLASNQGIRILADRAIAGEHVVRLHRQARTQPVARSAFRIIDIGGLVPPRPTAAASAVQPSFGEIAQHRTMWPNAAIPHKRSRKLSAISQFKRPVPRTFWRTSGLARSWKGDV
jgi:hypothetical protein